MVYYPHYSVDNLGTQVYTDTMTDRSFVRLVFVLIGFTIGMIVGYLLVPYADATEPMGYPLDYKFITETKTPKTIDEIKTEKVIADDLASKYAKLYDSCKNK